MNIPERFNKINKSKGFDLVTNDRESIVKFRKLGLIERLMRQKLNHPYEVVSIKSGKVLYVGYFITQAKALEKSEKLAFERNEEIVWNNLENN